MKTQDPIKKPSPWAAAVVAAGLVLAGYAGFQVASPSPAEAAPAKKVANFKLTDQNGVAHELYGLGKSKAVVIITQGNGCPIVRNNAVGYRQIVAQYKPKGVEFLMLNPNIQDNRTTVSAEAKEFGYNVPILMDPTQAVAKQLGVERTAEMFVINPKTWQLVYRGPMDDRVVFERQKAKADKTWGKDALDALLAGRQPRVAFQQVNGCIINIV